jgi:hypothetical protein
MGHMTKHVAIPGARRRTDRETVDRLVASLPADIVIVSAERKARHMGRGGRTQARARDQNISPRPRWSRKPRQRYHVRNQQIVDAADEVFALVASDRKGGTEDTIRRADTKGIAVTIL